MRGGGGGSTDLQLLFEAQRPQRVAARRESAMQINSDKDAQQTAAAADTVGPLNAHEADRCVEDLCTFSFEQIGGHKWMTQHEALEKLNVQTHVNASQQRDEFVMEALVLHEKIPLLIRELVSTELWKENVFPLVHEFLSAENSIKGYMLLYHEAVLINLLESVLYHKQACEAAGDMIVELMTMCGFTLDPEKTPLPARSQTILGIECRLYSTWRKSARHTYVVARLDEAKTKVWIDMINGILRVEKLEQHDAEKLAGRLNFLVFSVAGRPGASRLSRLYTAIYRPQTVVSPGLRSDLLWWLRFLTERTSKSYAINRPRDKVVTLYTDAEGKGGIGGVIFVTNEKPLQFAFKVPKVFNEMFSHRMTYIIQLELLAVTVALKLFCNSLTGAAVKFFIDNRSVLGSLRKGRSKVEDLNTLVLMTIDKTVHIDQCLFSWIPSKLNLADLPSRGQLVTDITTVDCAEVVGSLIDELRNSMHASQVTAKRCMDTVA